MTFTSYNLAGPDPNPMTVAEVAAIKTLVVTLPKDPIIINIGAERGTSTLAMLEERPDAVIFSIDVAPCEGEMENLVKAGLDRWRVIRLLGNSAKIGEFWPYPANMIHVDGNHSFEGVKADIKTWSNKLMPERGILSFHDYFDGDPPAHNPSGAGQAVRELIEPELIWREIIYVDRLKAFRRDRLVIEHHPEADPPYMQLRPWHPYGSVDPDAETVMDKPRPKPRPRPETGPKGGG